MARSQAKPRNTANAQLTVSIVSSSKRPNTGPSRSRSTELGLSTITCDASRRPFVALGRTVMRNKGESVTGVYPLVRGMYNKRDDEIKASGWKNQFKLGGVALVADLNYSKATRNETSLENNTQLVPSPQYDTVGMNFRSGDFSSFRPALSYADPTKLFLRGTIYGSGYGKTPSVEDELTGPKLGAKFPTSGSVGSLFADIDVGLNYADRSKKKRQPEGNINVGKQGDTAIAADLQYAPVNLGFAGLGTIPAWNVPGAVGRFMTFNPSETAAA